MTALVSGMRPALGASLRPALTRSSGGPRAGVVPAWEPSQLSELVLWYDLSDASSITQSAGKVSAVANKVDGAPSLTQAVALDQPTYVAAERNGLSVMRTDGVDQWIYFQDGPDAGASFGIFLAFRVKNTVGVANNCYFSSDLGGSELSFAPASNASGEGGVRVFGYGSPRLNITWSQNPAPPEAWGVQSFTLDTSVSPIVAQNYFNGSHLSSVDGNDTDTITTAFSRLILGSRNNGNSPQDADFGEVIVVSNPTDTDRERIEGYLAHKWGLVSDLASDHPYKSAAPTTLWTPGDTPLEAWYDASDTSTLTIGAGNEVTTLADKSGNDRDLTLHASQSGPTLDGGALRFAGDRLQQEPAESQTRTLNLIVAMKHRSGTGMQPWGGEQNYAAIRFDSTPGEIYRANGYGGYITSAINGGGEAPPKSGTGPSDAVANTDASNGVDVIAAYRGTDANQNGRSIGAWWTSADTDIYEYVALDGAVSYGQNRWLVEGYLAHKWGIALASGHPYKTAAPRISDAHPARASDSIVAGMTRDYTYAPAAEIPNAGDSTSAATIRCWIAVDRSDPAGLVWERGGDGNGSAVWVQPDGIGYTIGEGAVTAVHAMTFTPYTLIDILVAIDPANDKASLYIDGVKVSTKTGAITNWYGTNPGRFLREINDTVRAEVPVGSRITAHGFCAASDLDMYYGELPSDF